MSDKARRITPAALLYTVWTTSRHLAYYEQQDAHELLIALLDTLTEHLHVNHGDFNVATVTVDDGGGVEGEREREEGEGSDSKRETSSGSAATCALENGTEGNVSDARAGGAGAGAPAPQYQCQGIVNEVRLKPRSRAVCVRLPCQ